MGVHFLRKEYKVMAPERLEEVRYRHARHRTKCSLFLLLQHWQLVCFNHNLTQIGPNPIEVAMKLAAFTVNFEQVNGSVFMSKLASDLLKGIKVLGLGCLPYSRVGTAEAPWMIVYIASRVFWTIVVPWIKNMHLASVPQFCYQSILPSIVSIASDAIH